MKIKISYMITFIVLFVISCTNQNGDINTDMLDSQIAKYVKTEIKYDENLLDENQKIVVQKLYEAAKIIDEIFLEQVYSRNFEIRDELLKSNDPADKKKLEYFNINFGPFDRLDHEKPFIGTTPKPLGANFYPEDMTKEEFTNWIKEHPEDEKAFTSEFTIIRREGEKLIAVPYSDYYRENLAKISNLLREAAEFAENETLKNYLLLRAKAFETNDYYESDMAWMDLKDHTIEVVIGPYEVYEDAMFNYKASYECFLTLVDPEETQKLKTFANYLNEMEANLPIPDEHKNFDRGSDSPIMVVQEVFGAGDTKAGVQTLAFNLPNDERVRKAKGSKKVMLKNLHEAKYEKLLKPISEIVLDPGQLKYVTFDGFFTHTLMHEMSHGIGPGFIKVNGKETEVKKELKETYSTLEECKADILGMFNNKLMIDKGILPASFENEMWVTFLAGTFRSVRFGINEAHGGGNAIIYNYLLENGAYEFDKSTEKVKVNFDKIYSVLKDLANKVLMIQAIGDYQAALNLKAKYVVQSESMKILVDKLAILPVDIKPEFEIENK
ncbi:MAG: peptidase [Ignavibacteriae bacterium]|nr:peptidase [Ignavibacteriota bacterium]MCB9208865.1 peptidase [Ignavibacteriales bacterium]MCB9218217.1 peptidase [Ignavibacteriales bacterium]MCB9260718.1 peptidase [Ignavibacteriales bacterium]